jgi:uncharacterized protein
MAGAAFRRRLAGALLLGLAETAVVLGLAAAVTGSATAQQFDDRFPFIEERQRRGYSPYGGGDTRQAPSVESNAKAPSPARKADAAPLTSVVVLGDSMADWLAYGLEQAAADSPDIGILRRHRTWSGLIRIDVKNDPRGEYPDWPQAAREILNADKANFIVMMIGLNDRRSIKEKAPAKGSSPAGAAPGASPPPVDTERGADKEKDAANDDAPPEVPTLMAEPERVTPGMVSYEFRSDKWTELYIKRIDDTITALKAKNVPVFWVGLPPVRGPKAASDLSYLNDLFRSRAEKAGITYIDTWDGFVDEQGRFVMQGPDFEGQIRRLRSGDGVHFTQAGARKLAHFVEREIQRALMAHATPVALPATEEPAPQAAAPAARPGNAAIARPLAGPVMPLTTAAEADELLGGARTPQGTVDPIATRVLVRGEETHAPAGRADDFAWPRRNVAPLGTDPVVATTTTPITPMQTPEQQQRQVATVGPPAPAAPTLRRPAPGAGPARQAAIAPSRPFGNLFGPPQQQQAQRRMAPVSQPFFFPFFGR